LRRDEATFYGLTLRFSSLNNTQGVGWKYQRRRCLVHEKKLFERTGERRSKEVMTE
jgi:hypothetical protein